MSRQNLIPLLPFLCYTRAMITTDTPPTETKKKHKRIRIALLVLLLLLFFLYWVVCYFLVSLALVPSFMEKTEVFNTVTEVSIEALVQTDEVKSNRAALWDETRAWLDTAQAEKLSVTTEDGYHLVGVLFSPSEDAASPIPAENSHRWVLLLHGYTGWKEELYPIACQYVQEGYHALVPDMRCSGESQGDFIGMGWTDRLDNLLWLQEIIRRDPEAEIVLQGQSMGASCALMMSGEVLPNQVKAVVSDCAYTDAYSMFAKQMKDWFGLPPFPILDSMNLMLQLRGGYNLKDASALNGVKNTSLPVLLIHGKEDDMVPVSMAQELYDAAAGEKELLVIPGAGHAQAMEKDPELYFETIFRFLKHIS